MKITNKKNWGDFIYGLIYPGFVGSMIYELIPQTKEAFSFEKYFTILTILKILITFFYSLDYLHLYGDMHNMVKKEKRNWTYLLCDIFSSVFFFMAFVSVKVEHIGLGVFFISLIPFLFFTYKRPNYIDRKFHFPYFILSIGIGIMYFLNWIFDWNWIVNSETFLLYFTVLSFLTYVVYVFYYYEKFSKTEDERLYKIKNQTKNTLIRMK